MPVRYDCHTKHTHTTKGFFSFFRPSPVRVRDVHSRSARLGDEAFLDGSVSYMASEKRHGFAADLRTEVFERASALLTSVRLSSSQPSELLSVRQAWSDMDHSTWTGQKKAGPTLALVTALRLAHDAAKAPVLWPCLLYTSPSPRDRQKSRMPSSA